MSFFTRTLLLFLLISGAALAEDERWFQVEVMIFKNPITETDNPEIWPTFADIEKPNSRIRLKGTFNPLDITRQTNETEDNSKKLETPVSINSLNAFEILPANQHLLISERNKLIRSRGYELLFHEAWNQPVPNRSRVIPIEIEAGEQFGRQFELQGYINLYVERFLHLNANLHLVQFEKSTSPFSIVDDQSLLTPISQTSLQEANSFSTNSLLSDGSNQFNQTSEDFFISVQHAQLEESRRMRSRELHYLDTPAFGLLIYITPIELIDP